MARKNRGRSSAHIYEVLALSRRKTSRPNSPKVVELAEAKVLPHFDFERMTRLAVGRNWQQATPDQRKALTDAFRTLLVRTYSTSLSQYRNQSIEVKPTKMAAGDKEATVRTAVIQQGGPPIPIEITPGERYGWRARLIIDGRRCDHVSRLFNDPIQRRHRAL